jgi:hypothetical protein
VIRSRAKAIVIVSSGIVVIRRVVISLSENAYDNAGDFAAGFVGAEGSTDDADKTIPTFPPYSVILGRLKVLGSVVSVFVQPV